VRRVGNTACTNTTGGATVSVTTTAQPAPTVALHCGAANQPGYANAALIITYETTNATGATVSGLPTGMSSAWAANILTIYGTPTVTGSFSYTVSTTNTSACADASASGSITLAATPPTLPEGTTAMWVCGTQIWSDALKKDQTGCTETNYFPPVNPNPPASALYRKSGLQAGSGYFYNGKCVNEQQLSLCPYPWRVPTVNDFITLDICFGGSGENRTNENLSWMINNYYTAWGAVVTGHGYKYEIAFGNVETSYSTTNVISSSQHYLGYLDNTGSVSPQAIDWSLNGREVRCVRDY
jgi:hypothetical protein